MDTQRQKLDESALKFNQIAIVTLVVAGFILDAPILPAIVALVLLAGSVHPGLALFKVIYRRVLLPLKLMSPKLVDDLPAPHQFAQLLGGVVLAVGVLFLAAGGWWRVVGWALSWVVLLLAAANLSLGFCAGCFVYYQLVKHGIPGFRPGERTRA